MSTEHARNLEVYQDNQEKVQKEERHVVKKKVGVQRRWVTRGEKMLYSLFGAVLISSMLYITSYGASVDSLNRDIQSLETKVEEQSVYNKNLSYKVKELSQPERIIANAKKHGLKIQNTEVKQASELVE
ncbi:cell division protein FtsL [Gracilibacillus sp. YIM 98692]|uniref:cell division protein FtsL n=1 Tax=Gracilibacillus sp. YIM 98692 TaxID=2663532 RepID=UPI0013D894C7|nr:cell division protein FtsL [Gracilibacillus sp. YIM 98692]